MDGVLVVDKPVGPTSHDVVTRVRRAMSEPRIGHTGTLDPGASGVLPLVIGRATRLARFLSAGDKSYEAVIRLGFSTDTGDAQGQPVSDEWRGGWPSRAEVELALDTFRGTFVQQPPAYSAKKIDGARSHRMARRMAGKPADARSAVLPSPVQVTTRAVEVISQDGHTIALSVTCSAGFYVRSLAHDLGERLGMGGHIVGLRRTGCADFSLRHAVPLDVVEADRHAALAAVVPLPAMLPSLPSVSLTETGVVHASHGRDLGQEDLLEGSTAALAARAAAVSAEPCVKLLDLRGELVGIARLREADGVLHPFVVLM